MAEDLPGGFIPQVLAFAAHLITPLEHLAAQTPGSRPTTFDPLSARPSTANKSSL
jgi:hypothetical protein